LINEDSLPLRNDAEMPRANIEKLNVKIQFGSIIVKLEGYYEGLGIADSPFIIVSDTLQKEVGINEELAQQCVAIAKIKTEDR
jgi:hypothetical protein